MAAMAVKSSSLKKERLALEQALERFHSRAVSELWFLKDHLPRSDPLARSGGDYAPTSPVEAWAKARQRHKLARQGLIPWQADFVPPSRPPASFRDKAGRPDASDWFTEPRAA